MSRPRQIMPRRLEVVIEKLDLAKESFVPQSADWLLLDNCQRQIKELLMALYEHRSSPGH